MNDAILKSNASSAFPSAGRHPCDNASERVTMTDVTLVSGDKKAIEPTQILRFRESERVLHWSIAIPFMVCYATGIILMIFFNLHSHGIARSAYSWLHRISGACLIVFPLLSALRDWRDYRIHLDNIRQAWTWAARDLRWLFLMGAAAISRRIKLPEQDKFNAAEKLNFMMVLCTYPFFIVTGLFLWMPQSAVLFWMVHVGMALLATPLMLGHIYMALINPGTRAGLSGMFSGYVDRNWAKHHYQRWYGENFEEAQKTGRDQR